MAPVSGPKALEAIVASGAYRALEKPTVAQTRVASGAYRALEPTVAQRS